MTQSNKREVEQMTHPFAHTLQSFKAGIGSRAAFDDFEDFLTVRRSLALDAHVWPDDRPIFE